MRASALSLAILATIPLPLLTQCEMGSAPPTNVVTGPFDSRGNYIEDWVDKPQKWYKPSSPSTQPEPSGLAGVTPTQPEPPPQIALVQPKPQTTSQAKPKPTQVSSKPKPKPKPAPPKVVRHTVKKGDTLSGISRRYGCSVSSIQKANGLRGTVIRIGQSLKIPR